MLQTSSFNVLEKALRTSGPLGALAKQTLRNLLESNYSQEKELEADRVAVQLAQSAGFKADAAVEMLEKLKSVSRDQSSVFNYFSSHPPFNDRIREIKEQI